MYPTFIRRPFRTNCRRDGCGGNSTGDSTPIALCGRDVTLRGWCVNYSQVKEPNRRQDRQTLENFYYEPIYTALQDANNRYDLSNAKENEGPTNDSSWTQRTRARIPP